MNDQINELVKYRSVLADETLQDAKLLIDNNRFRSALNRIYYSCFYSVSALLLSKNLSSKTHKGIKTLLNSHFIETGILSQELGKFYSRLFNFRQENDYHYLQEIEIENVNELYQQAENFITIIKEHINKSID